MIERAKDGAAGPWNISAIGWRRRTAGAAQRVPEAITIGASPAVPASVPPGGLSSTPTKNMHTSAQTAVAISTRAEQGRVRADD